MRSRFYPAVVLSLLLAVIPSRADADDAPDPDAPRARTGGADHVVSVTTDPTRVLYGVAALGAEARVGRVTVHKGFSPRDVSIAGWVGVGRVRTGDITDPRAIWESCGDLFWCERATMVWVGAQALLYPVGGFERGAQLGVEASYLGLFGTRSYNASFVSLENGIVATQGKPGVASVPEDRFTRNAFVPGVVVGYKLATKAGFTFNPQLALDMVLSSEPVNLAPRLALNVGWSF
jgi:hypothetical protein